MLKVMKSLSMEVGRRLRESGMYARNVSIWIKYSNFVKVSKQMNLDNAIHNDSDIYNISIMLFDKLWNKEDNVRGLCVGVSNFKNTNDNKLAIIILPKYINKYFTLPKKFSICGPITYKAYILHKK